jgi:hypothetical protein
MKHLLKTTLFSAVRDFLLPEKEVSDGYDEFVGALFAERYNAPDMNAFYDCLCYTKAELKSLLKQQRGLLKKKCPYRFVGESDMDY